VANLSPFVHLAPVPNAPPAWAAIWVLIAIGLILIIMGAAGYSRRDLTT
jgi:ABC-2 type transport system permease protein